MALKHESYCELVNPAALVYPAGRDRRCTCSASIDQTPQDWVIEENVGSARNPRWRAVELLSRCPRRDAEQHFFRGGTEKRHLVNAARTVTISVPHGTEREE